MPRQLHLEYPGAVYHVLNPVREKRLRPEEPLRAQVAERRGVSHYGEEWQESAVEKAARLGMGSRASRSNWLSAQRRKER